MIAHVCTQCGTVVGLVVPAPGPGPGEPLAVRLARRPVDAAVRTGPCDPLAALQAVRRRWGHHAPSECRCRRGEHGASAYKERDCHGWHRVGCHACGLRQNIAEADPGNLASLPPNPCLRCDPLLEPDAVLPEDVQAAVDAVRAEVLRGR